MNNTCNHVATVLLFKTDGTIEVIRNVDGEQWKADENLTYLGEAPPAPPSLPVALSRS